MQNVDVNFASAGKAHNHASTKMTKRPAQRLHGVATNVRKKLNETETEKRLCNIVHPHLDALDTEEDDESDDQRDFGAISEHPVNFIESMSETDESSDEETLRVFTTNHCNHQQKKCANDWTTWLR